MSFWDNVKKFAQPYADDDYDEYEDEEMEGFEEFNEKYSEYVIWQAIEKDEEEPDPDLDYTEHAYCLDISSLLGINQRGAYDVREKYALICISSENPNTCFRVLTEMFDMFTLTEETE